MPGILPTASPVKDRQPLPTRPVWPVSGWGIRDFPELCGGRCKWEHLEPGLLGLFQLRRAGSWKARGCLLIQTAPGQVGRYAQEGGPH